MATTFTSSSLPSLYDDDYSQSDNYHQILFNNGRALQARELTQLQTLIYEEMGRFGRNIFKEGAAVSSGVSSINASYEYVKISSTNDGGLFSDIPVGTIFQSALTGVSAKVVSVYPTDDDFAWDTLYIQYVDTADTTVADETVRFGDGETLFDLTGLGYQLVTEAINATGRGVRFDVSDGDFFVMGRFVHANEQTVIISPYEESIDAIVGFKVVQEIITVNDTNDLYDNSGDTLNTASPGADRYRIQLQLTTQDKVTTDDTFVFIARVENSKIVEEIEESDAYNKINDLLALRTNEESGNYITNPFTMHFENVTDSGLDMIISSGTAYVNGYRVENPSPIKLNVPKPTSTDTVTNDVVPVVYGNYFRTSSSQGLPDINTLDSVGLYDAIDAGGSLIGTARVRGLEKNGGDYLAYVFDVDVDSASSIGSVKSLGNSATDYLNISLEGDSATLEQTLDNDLLFPTSRPRLESLNDITYTYQEVVSVTIAGGTGALPVETGTTNYADTSLWFASDSSGFDGDFTVNIGDPQAPTITAGLTNGTWDVLVYKQDTVTPKTKIETTATATLAKQTATNADGTAFYYYDIGLPDVYSLDSAKDSASGLIDFLGTVTLDDGQRDNYYADARVLLADDSAPANLYVNYKYFARGGSGSFYCASSYPVAYNEIPTHVLQDGTEVNLFNFIDFRPDKNDGTFTNIHLLPRNGSNITADISYYLPRADKLLVTQEGDFQVLMGQQSENPQFKPTPDNSLELYKILLNANTLSVDDLQTTQLEYKSYTMEDIGKLEAKVDKLEEYTTMRFLELEQKIDASLDSAGVERIISGLQVDEFTDQTGADVTNDDYSASIDPESKMIRPKVNEDNIRLIQDATLSSNVTKKGDNIYLNYSESDWQKQELASTSVKVNPTGAVDNVGVLKISPASDEWKESKEIATHAVTGANKVARVQAFLWNNWTWNWTGRRPEDFHVDTDLLVRRDGRIRRRAFLEAREKYNSSTSRLPNRTSNGKFVTRVLPEGSLRRISGGRVVDVAVIPWMRSRKIYFHARGLTPNTKFTPFFDGVAVNGWCREEASFVQWSDRTDDQGNQNRQTAITSHPDGSTELVSDANGEIIGSFFIPNIRPKYKVNSYRKGKRLQTEYIRFRTGMREFKLLDISKNDWASAGSKCFTYYTALGSVDKKYRNVLATRFWDRTSPVGALRKKIRTYSPAELKTGLDNVTADAVNIFQPKQSGRYGPINAPLTNSALASIDANGTMSTVLSDYINVNQNQFASGVNNLQIPQNPMSQTFYVDNPYGVILTSINLFFKSKDTGNIPVQIHIRPIEEGKPSMTTIVPDSHVVLNAGSVDAIGEDPVLSTITSRPTTFEFDEPVYLQPWTNYAIVVTSQSIEYELFSAKTKQRVYGSTSRTVTTQPAPGSLFLPQNGTSWLESKDQDLMFTLKRAVFDLGGGSLVLQNANLPSELLDENPIRTTDTSGTIYVKHECHGHEVGDSVTLAGTVDVNGITSAQMNTTHTVVNADLHGYTVTTAGTANASGVGGGEAVIATKNVVFSTANLYQESIIPNFTSTDTSARFTSGKYISGSNTRFTRDEQYQRVTPNVNIDFNKPKAIYNSTVETAQLGAGVTSTYVKVDLKTSNDYVSPIIDLQRASLVLAGYCIDDPTVTPHIYPIDETRPYGGSTGCKHISTPVTLEEAARGIDANFKVNLPSGSNCKFYYRTAGADQNIYDQRWTERDAEFTIPNDNDTSFREARFLAGGKGGTLKPFNQAQVKIVATGQDQAFSAKELAIKYLVK